MSLDQDVMQEIDEIFRNGYFRAMEQGNYQEVILHGLNAEKAGEVVKEYLENQGYDVMQVASPDQEIPESNNHVVLYLDLRNFPETLERIRDYAKTRENTKILVVDPENKHKGIERFSYSYDMGFFFKDT